MHTNLKYFSNIPDKDILNSYLLQVTCAELSDQINLFGVDPITAQKGTFAFAYYFSSSMKNFHECSIQTCDGQGSHIFPFAYYVGLTI